MSRKRIPFNRPFIVGKELYYIAQAVHFGHLAGNGIFTKKCEKWMEAKFNAKKILLTHSCTAALEICAILSQVRPGDEVIMPSYTFVSTANAFVLRGAEVRFVDISPDTLNIDENLIEAAITEKTKVIVPVHYAGVACDMDKINTIAKAHDLLVVEDAAQGVNATYNNRFLGTIGHIGAYSFHETKNFISGEGGALVINDEKFIERAEIVWEKGTNRSKFFRGEIDKYTWVDIGSSYLPSELVAAFLYAQLEEADSITNKRKKIYDYYKKNLQPLEEKGQIRLPHIPPGTQHNAHIFYVILNSEKERDEILLYLRHRKIHAVFHYVPLHSSIMGQRFGYKQGDLPVTEDTASRLIRLPCYYELEQEDQDRVIATIFDFFS